MFDQHRLISMTDQVFNSPEQFRVRDFHSRFTQAIIKNRKNSRTSIAITAPIHFLSRIKKARIDQDAGQEWRDKRGGWKVAPQNWLCFEKLGQQMLPFYMPAAHSFNLQCSLNGYATPHPVADGAGRDLEDRGDLDLCWIKIEQFWVFVFGHDSIIATKFVLGEPFCVEPN